MVNAKNTIALLFTGGDGPSARQILNIVEEARSISCTGPVLAAADSGLLLAGKAGLKPHWIIGDMDSLNNADLASYPPEKVLRFPRAKDFTDTELALSHLLENNYKKFWIIGGGGGRIDHLFALRSLFERKQAPERWITASEDIRCLEGPLLSAINKSSVTSMEMPLTEAQRHKEVINIPSELSTHTNGLVSVFPMGEGPWEVESTGLRWPLAGLPWTRGFFGLSNEAPEGSFSITARKGRFMVVLPL